MEPDITNTFHWGDNSENENIHPPPLLAANDPTSGGSASPPCTLPLPPFFRENKKQISLMSIRDRRNPVKKLI